MKWRNRTARPSGLGKRPTELALKGPPNPLDVAQYRTSVDHHRCGSKVAHFGRPFRADVTTNVPRAEAWLKPWAVLLRHFMAALALLR